MTVLIAILTAVLMLTTKIDTLWIILGAALATFSASSFVPLLAL